MDAVHFVWETGFLTCLWCFARIFVRTSSGRKRYNVLGALNAVTKKLLTVVNDSYINSQSVGELLQKLRDAHGDEKITVVLDNAAYQRCKFVKQIAAELDITLLFLPPYSPNLNLIERLWKFVKKRALNNRYYDTFGAFQTGIATCLANLDTQHKSEIASLMTLRFQTFKTDHIVAG